MRICGVELTSNEAVLCLLDYQDKQFTLPECRIRKLTLTKEHSQADLQQLQFAFNKLMEDYRVDKVAIKARPTKGKFAGGAISFKLEATIQLNSELPVELLNGSDVKQALSSQPLPIPFAETGLKKFQQEAFTTAYAAQVIS